MASKRSGGGKRRTAKRWTAAPRAPAIPSDSAIPREVAVIHRLATLTNSEADLDRIMAAIVTEATSAFSADAASIALDDERGGFEMAASYGLSDRYVRGRHLNGARLRELYGDPPTEFFGGPDVLATMGQPEVLRSEGIRSMFFVPLMHRNQLVGSLALYGRGRDLGLSLSEIRLAQLFAAQAAGALRRARVAQSLAERIRDYDVLTRIGRALASRLDVDYEHVLRILHDELGYEHLAVFSLERNPPRLVLKSFIGYGEELRDVTFPLGVGVVGWVAEHGTMAYVPDAPQDPRYVPNPALKLRSLLVYPLKVGDQVLGALSVDDPEPDAFTARDRRILEAFADQCAIALSNANQFVTSRKRNESLSAARSQLEGYAASLERQQTELQLLNDVSAAATKTLDLDEMLSEVAQTIAQGLKADRCGIALVNDARSRLEVVAEYRADGGPVLKGQSENLDADSVFADVVKQRKWLVSEDMLADPRFGREREAIRQNGLRACAMVPMVADGQMALGRVSVNSTSGPRSFDADEVNTIQTAANQLAMAVRNAQLYRRERERANEDSLTGLLNHRSVQERLDAEISRATRSSQPFALVIIDLDEFKHLNDRFGHQVGDDVLRTVARELQASLRASDVAARYGGDEFVVILADTDDAGAQQFVERFRRRLGAQSVDGLGDASIRWSAGAAIFPRDGRSKKEIIAVADAAMYAKKRGASTEMNETPV